MADFLYTLVIYPLTLIIETAFRLSRAVCGDRGFAVIGVSVAVSLLCLPLYIVAEAWQDIERKKQKQMQAGIERIKKAFKGDEQYMVLTTFYKQNHYHPLMALRSSFGLLIQVPFFMAAYSFLSNLSVLQGYKFFFIRDMGKPDALFYIGSFPINILPIAMTIINIAGSAVYTKGFKLKEKLPIYAMALIFLAILYDSPAGLVLYWTMNNVFSLVKNIFYKIKRPLLALYLLACAAAAAGIFRTLFIHNGLFSKRVVLALLFALVFFIPLFAKAAVWALKNPLKELTQNKSLRHSIFLLCAFSLALLTGLVIPSYTISSSVQEFVDIDGIMNPNHYILTTLVQSMGFFVFWLCCVYFLFGKKVQTLMAFAASLALLWAAANAFVFGGNYGILSRVLIFEKTVVDSAAAKAINGTILDAGEEFSFNDTVGKRSEQRGYKNAKIISDGNFVEGVGGGVCQVSTTLYNAALLSGLTVTEYHPHTLAVSYVKSSFDAMVSYGSCDLKFKNTTDSPVYIRAACNSGELTVTVYGKKLDCVYERESVVDQTIKPKILKTLDQSLSEGEYVVVTHPKDGVKSCGYLIKKQNGKVVWRKLIRKDSYKAVDGVIKVGSDNAYPDKPLG